jgi:uncharacterized membrane protein
MLLAPLLNARPVVPVHAFATLAAGTIGVLQQAAPNGRVSTLAKSLCRDVVAGRPASERATPCTIEPSAR